MKLKFACIGDIHGFWEDRDTEYFNQSDYDFLLLTGDLPDHKPFSAGRKKLYEKLNRLSIPTYMCLGNWDGANFTQLIGEVFQNRFLIQLGGMGHIKRVDRLKQSLSNIEVSSYTVTSLANENLAPKGRNILDSKDASRFEQIGLLIGRPFTCGGPHLGFTPSLRKLFGITSMGDSVTQYKKIIDSCKGHYDRIIILSHNGPTGLGDKATHIYGCDFRKEEGDWGDPDLEEAIRYAKESGFQIPLVVSGHMHHRNPKTKSKRKWKVKKDDTIYLNAAKVPRMGTYYSVELDGAEASIKLNYIDRSL
ncbi:MAG: metallophosphoesterase [Leptospira sp.]|nr:metallophosphoesterase [Leptospira sp.]